MKRRPTSSCLISEWEITGSWTTLIRCRGDDWHRLRQEDFTRVDLGGMSPELFELIKSMMQMDPARRVDVQTVWAHPVIGRARAGMKRLCDGAGQSMFAGSPLAGVDAGFLEEILGRGVGLGVGVEEECMMDIVH